MKLCVIPARGGSKRIPRKNIRDFCGKPMIAWSIHAAQKSGCFDRILVSTDDLEIANLSQQLGADVPFLRPAALSGDHTGTIDVVVHAITFIQQAGVALDAVCCLYATAPFVQPMDLQEGLRLLPQVPAGRFVFTITRYAFPIQRAIRVRTDGYTQMWQEECFGRRSQDLEEAYHDAGQFYWGRPEAWQQCTNLFDGSLPLLLPRWRVQDIDTEEDWSQAGIMHRVLQEMQRGH